MEGMWMRKTVLLGASMALALVLACVTAALTAVPGVGQTATVTLVGAGDIASCSYNEDSATARLLGRIPGTVFTLGDNAYTYGTAAEFKNCYDPTWGKYRKRTRPTAGNHEYYTSGAKPYFDYFGWRAGRPNRGYYSYDRGAWHIVVLNSNCSKVGGCGRRSAQGRWLRKDLANHQARCTLAYFHHPLYAPGSGTATAQVKPFWNILYDRGADIILSGHAHRYERYAPIRPGGATDQANGIRQFIVGTGGNSGGGEIHYNNAPGVQRVKLGTPGVLRLNLAAGSYTWKFVPIAGKTWSDSGTDQCH
jgi:Calcineurin-like phosphoesterase